jgi:hypothetical protein
MRYVRKEFLSPCADESGSMVIQVETPLASKLYVYEKEKGKPYVRPDLEAFVTFRACYGEPVKIELGADSQKAFEKRIAKVSLMIDELTKMRGQMTEMWHSHLRDIDHKIKTHKEDD